MGIVKNSAEEIRLSLIESSARIISIEVQSVFRIQSFFEFLENLIQCKDFFFQLDPNRIKQITSNVSLYNADSYKAFLRKFLRVYQVLYPEKDIQRLQNAAGKNRPPPEKSFSVSTLLGEYVEDPLLFPIGNVLFNMHTRGANIRKFYQEQQAAMKQLVEGMLTNIENQKAKAYLEKHVEGFSDIMLFPLPFLKKSFFHALLFVIIDIHFVLLEGKIKQDETLRNTVFQFLSNALEILDISASKTDKAKLFENKALKDKLKSLKSSLPQLSYFEEDLSDPRFKTYTLVRNLFEQSYGENLESQSPIWSLLEVSLSLNQKIHDLIEKIIQNRERMKMLMNLLLQIFSGENFASIMEKLNTCTSNVNKHYRESTYLEEKEEDIFKGAMQAIFFISRIPYKNFFIMALDSIQRCFSGNTQFFYYLEKVQLMASDYLKQQETMLTNTISFYPKKQKKKPAKGKSQADIAKEKLIQLFQKTKPSVLQFCGLIPHHTSEQEFEIWLRGQKTEINKRNAQNKESEFIENFQILKEEMIEKTPAKEAQSVFDVFEQFLPLSLSLYIVLKDIKILCSIAKGEEVKTNYFINTDDVDHFLLFFPEEEPLLSPNREKSPKGDKTKQQGKIEKEETPSIAEVTIETENGVAPFEFKQPTPVISNKKTAIKEKEITEKQKSKKVAHLAEKLQLLKSESSIHNVTREKILRLVDYCNREIKSFFKRESSYFQVREGQKHTQIRVGEGKNSSFTTVPRGSKEIKRATAKSIIETIFEGLQRMIKEEES